MAVAVTKLNIVNMVLANLGKLPVANAMNDPNGALILQAIDQYFPQLLLRANWNWSIKYVTDNNPITDATNPYFRFGYQLPADYGRMNKIVTLAGFSSIGAGTGWAIIDNILWVNTDPVSYYYQVNQSVFLDGNFSVCTQVFLNALAFYVAGQVCLPITNNIQLRQQNLDNYQISIIEAGKLNRYDQQIITMPNNDYDRVSLFS